MCIEYFSKKDPNGKLSIEKHVANKSPKEYSELIIYCSKFIEFNLLPFKEKVYCYINQLTELPKCYCGNKLLFKDKLSGYRTYCSIKCGTNHVDRKDMVSIIVIIIISKT